VLFESSQWKLRVSTSTVFIVSSNVLITSPQIVRRLFVASATTPSHVTAHDVCDTASRRGWDDWSGSGECCNYVHLTQSNSDTSLVGDSVTLSRWHTHAHTLARAHARTHTVSVVSSRCCHLCRVVFTFLVTFICRLLDCHVTDAMAQDIVGGAVMSSTRRQELYL